MRSVKGPAILLFAILLELAISDIAPITVLIGLVGLVMTFMAESGKTWNLQAEDKK